jgi:hypothetical protein
MIQETIKMSDTSNASNTKDGVFFQNGGIAPASASIDAYGILLLYSKVYN